MEALTFPYSAGDRVQINLKGVQLVPVFYRGREEGILDLTHLALQKFTFARNRYEEALIEDNIGVENEGFIERVWGRQQRVLLHPFYYVVFWNGYFIVLPGTVLTPHWRHHSWVGKILWRLLNRFV